MIRAYVAPTDQPVIWIEVPAGRITKDHGTAVIEVTTFEAEELREQMHRAVVLARTECERPSCTRHACYDDGGCHEHGEAS